jgi:hypothetical protein
MERNGKPGLVGISGPYRDSVLVELEAMERTNWSVWKQKHPDSKYVTE